MKFALMLITLFVTNLVWAQAPCQVGNCDPVGLPKEIKDLGAINNSLTKVSGIRVYFGVQGSTPKKNMALDLLNSQIDKFNQLNMKQSNKFLARIIAKKLNKLGGGKVSINDISQAYLNLGCDRRSYLECQSAAVVKNKSVRYIFSAKLIEE